MKVLYWDVFDVVECWVYVVEGVVDGGYMFVYVVVVVVVFYYVE